MKNCAWGQYRPMAPVKPQNQFYCQILKGVCKVSLDQVSVCLVLPTECSLHRSPLSSISVSPIGPQFWPGETLIPPCVLNDLVLLKIHEHCDRRWWWLISGADSLSSYLPLTTLSPPFDVVNNQVQQDFIKFLSSPDTALSKPSSLMSSRCSTSSVDTEHNLQGIITSSPGIKRWR